MHRIHHSAILAAIVQTQASLMHIGQGQAGRAGHGWAPTPARSELARHTVGHRHHTSSHVYQPEWCKTTDIHLGQLVSTRHDIVMRPKPCLPRLHRIPQTRSLGNNIFWASSSITCLVPTYSPPNPILQDARRLSKVFRPWFGLVILDIIYLFFFCIRIPPLEELLA